MVELAALGVSTVVGVNRREPVVGCDNRDWGGSLAASFVGMEPEIGRGCRAGIDYVNHN